MMRAAAIRSRGAAAWFLLSLLCVALPARPQPLSREQAGAVATAGTAWESLARYQGEFMSATALGFVGDGATDNTAAVGRLFALTGSQRVYFPPGTYMLTSCPSATWTAASAISLVGAGRGTTTIRFPSGCAFSADIFEWNGKSGVTIADLTLDLNNPVTITNSTVYSVIDVRAVSGSATGFAVERIAIINANPGLYLISPYAVGHALNGLVIRHNYLQFATPVAGDQSNNSSAIEMSIGTDGSIPHAVIEGNTVIGTVVQIVGQGGLLLGNDISGQGGAGLYTGETVPPTCDSWLIMSNSVHDAASTDHLVGFEIHCPHTIVANNQAYRNGGAGFFDSADYVLFTGNKAWDNGKAGPSTNLGVFNTSGFWIYPNTPFVGVGITLIGNIAFDDGAGIQLYGIGFCCSLTLPVTVDPSNNFTGVTQAILQQGLPGTVENAVNGGWIYRSKQTAVAGSAVASFAWTRLDTGSYHEWQLTCREIVPASAVKVYVQIGEGTGPTWITRDYAVSEYGVEGGKAITVADTESGLPIDHTTLDATGAAPANFTLQMGDLSTGRQKQLRITSAYRTSTGGPWGSLSGAAVHYGDANPVTALRVIATSGGLNGSCVVEGRP